MIFSKKNLIVILFIGMVQHSYAMKEQESIHDKSLHEFFFNKTINQKDYNIFRAVQTIKEIFSKTLEKQKGNISDFSYDLCKKHLEKATVNFRGNRMFESQGLHLLIHCAHVVLITPWGNIDLTSKKSNWAWYDYSKENKNWYVSTEDKIEIASLVKIFYKDLLSDGSIAITKTNGVSEMEVYTVDSVNTVILPKAFSLEKSNFYKDAELARKLWKAMEVKHGIGMYF